MNTTLVLGILLLASTFAQAQATRTWVSATGDDANTCGRKDPCVTFAGALAKTSKGGVISVIDPGGYGPVTITQSVTIDAGGMYASILAPNDINGIIVNADDKDVVVLRGLTIFGVGSGTDGIKFINGARLHVEDCRISGFTSRGINFAPTGKSELLVKDSVIRENGAAGILSLPAGGAASVAVNNCRLEANANGVSAQDDTQMTVRDSIVANNSLNGFLVLSSTESTQMNIESCVSTNNGAAGIKTSGVGGNTGTVRISNVTVTNNATGLLAGSGGSIESFKNNTIAGNTTNGAPSTSFNQQ
ncbi:MAG: right-handed parallel beta-helix repeat-containing protein [Pyrinomonadaceae bacterium]